MAEQEEQSETPKKEEPSFPKSGSNNKVIIIVAVVIGIFIVLGIAAFFGTKLFTEKTAEKAIEQATGGKVDIKDDGDKVTVETDEGKFTLGQDEIPKSFPSDITVYSGSTVVLTSEIDEDVTVSLKTSDSASTVSNFYKSDLTNNGWDLTTTGTVEGTSLFTAKKGGRQAIITVTTDVEDGKTIITIVVGSNLE